jgi:anaerobic selenocysteine-containing dehydrogenase
MCGIAITLDGERITAIKGDKDDPFSRGHICPKATALQDVYNDPDRLKQPVKRTADGWQVIGWDEAYDLAADGIKRAQAKHGDNAVGIYLGNPNVHNLGALLFNGMLVKALRTRNQFTATSVDQLPSQFVQLEMYGHKLLFPVPDVDRTDYFLVLGANPIASNGSLMTTGGIEPRLKALQKRGGKLVVIDPRRTATAKLADEHFYIRPNSDILLLAAMLHTLFAENLNKSGRLADFTDGINELRELVHAFTPELAARHTGIAAKDIRRLAREVAAAESAIVYGRMGLSTQQFGGLCQWLIQCLNIVTGNLDRPGGLMFTTPAFDIINKRNAGKIDRWTSRVRKLPEVIGELPVATLAEEISTPGDGQIRAMVTVAGNPILSTPNGTQLDAAFADLDFMLAIDIYINETTRHADLILPPTTGLECEHYDVSFHLLALRNTAKYAPVLFTPDDEQRHDWQIYRELARRLATEDRPFNESDPRNVATPEQMVDFGLRNGPYAKLGLSVELLRANPHGIDFGPLEPRLPERLFTPNQRINLVPDRIVADLERVWRYVDDESQSVTDDCELLLIGRRHLRDNNSWMHNVQRLVKGKNRCTVLLNSADAHARKLSDGQTVRVTSRVGSVELPVQISDDIMPGVISIPHGYGHARDGVKMTIARQNPGVSANDLTDELLLDQLTGNAAVNGVPVTLQAT